METLGTGVGKVAFKFQIGSARTITFNFVGIDISAWTPILNLKRYSGDIQNTLSFTIGAGLSFVTYTEEIVATFTGTNTSIEEGEYYWELRRQDLNIPILCGPAFFDYDAQQGTEDSITINLTSTTIQVTTNNGGFSDNLKENVVSGIVLSGTDIYTGTYTPVPAAYIFGFKSEVVFTNANTGPATLNLNGLGPKPIKKSVSSPLALGDISAGQALLLLYDGANFQIIGGGTGGGSSLARTSVKTSGYSAVANNLVPVDTTGGNVQIILTAAQPDKAQILVKQITQGVGFVVTVVTSGSEVYNKTGGATSLTLSLLGQAVWLQFDSSSGTWTILSDDLPLSQLDLRYPTGLIPVDIDGTLAANSDTRIATQKATKTYVDNNNVTTSDEVETALVAAMIRLSQ